MMHFLRRPLLFLIIFISAGLMNRSDAQGQQRYNVVFIMIDDLSSHLNYLGHPEVITPNLQRLLNRGMAFTNAFNQFPVCNPSRTSFMSGWRPDKTNVQGNNQDPGIRMPPGANFLQEYLHKYGYRTERYGKIYHSQYEYEFSWDYSEGRADGGDRWNSEATEKTAVNYPAGSWGIYPAADTTVDDFSISRNLANRLLQPVTQPGFFALGLTTHNPFVPPLNFWNLYGSNNPSIALPYWNSTQTVLGNNANNIVPPVAPGNDRDDIPPIAIDPENSLVKEYSDWQKSIQAYYAEISAMDRNVGLVLDAIDSKNLWSNTIVIFTSDHGQHLGEHNGIWRKNTLFEESLKVPLIVCAPGLPAGTCNKFVELVDLFPTITELCKVPTPETLEGSSFVRLLQNPNQTWKRAAFSQVRTKDPYTLIDKCEGIHYSKYHYNYWGPYGEELYNREADPNEFVNLVTDPFYATVLDSVRLIRQQGWRNSLPPACDSVRYYKDADGDGFGNSDSLFKGCYQPIGYVTEKRDCNDNNPALNPGATEICDGIDNNCNGQVDENVVVAVITNGNQVSICSNSSVTLSANAVTGGKYQWLRNNTPIANATRRTLRTNLAGNYQVVTTVNSLCADSSNICVVNVLQAPAATITPLDNTDICALGFVRLRANNGPGITYQWRKDGVDISGATSRIYEARSAGNYQVVVTTTQGCSNLSKATTVTRSCFAGAAVVASTDALVAVPATSAGLTAYPNPAKGLVTLRFNTSQAGTVQVKLLTLAGQQVVVKKGSVVKGENTLPLTLPALSTGIYIVEVTDASGAKRTKLSVE